MPISLIVRPWGIWVYLDEYFHDFSSCVWSEIYFLKNDVRVLEEPNAIKLKKKVILN